MNRLFLADTKKAKQLLSCEAYEKKLLAKLPATWRPRIEQTRNVDLRHDRLLVYTLLAEAVCVEKWRIFWQTTYTVSDDEEHKFDNFPPLIFDEKKRPSLEGCKFDISVSHTDGMVAVAIAYSADSRIGVDIEKVSCEAIVTAEKFDKRYTKNVNIPYGDFFYHYELLDREDIFLFGFDENGITELCNYDLLEDSVTECEGLKKWTGVEAVLKSDGGGFGSLPNIGKLVTSHAIHTGVIKYHGTSFAITVAEKITISALIL